MVYACTPTHIPSMDDVVEIPCYFLCPISMQLMTDPVTTSSGITYDRHTIEKWLFSNSSCPVTKQPLTDDLDLQLTPNHTLRRLIQSWAALNSLDRIPTPKPVPDILKILDEAKRSGLRLGCLRRLRSIALRDEGGRSRLRAAGAVEFLASIVGGDDVEDDVIRDEAVGVLLEMDLSSSGIDMFGSGWGVLVGAVVRVLGSGMEERRRGRAMKLLKAAFEMADPARLIGIGPEVFVQTVHVLRDRISQEATKAALKLLMELSPWGKNRVKAIESGAVHALVELLLDQTSADRRACELALTVLDQLCSCAEGRAELLSHGAGLAIVSKKILRVSNAASDKGVRILGSISKYSGSSRVLLEMLQVGVVTKLCLVQQVEVNRKTKARAREILRMHSRVWKGSSCIPIHLLSSYPSS